jgi:ferredoxin
MEKSKNIKQWFADHKPTKRRIIQLYAALLTNANLKGYGNGKIYQGAVKNICAPGLNCYSCPAASASCPLGALQNALASSNARLPYYIFGIFLLFGILFGRWICGFLCPFGLLQDLLHKVKTPKLKKNSITRILSYLKYVILVVFVVLMPLIYSVQSFPLPGFCKYICPSGTLLGAGGLLSNEANSNMFPMLGPLFTWKFCLLVLILLSCIFIYRAFCRFLCPLGAIYGLFNRISILGIKDCKTMNMLPSLIVPVAFCAVAGLF